MEKIKNSTRLRRWTPRSSAPDSTVYVMERMGFGLSVAPKFFDAVVKWIVRDFEGVDNYIRAPNAMVAAVEAELSKYGLTTSKYGFTLTSSSTRQSYGQANYSPVGCGRTCCRRTARLEFPDFLRTYQAKN